MSTLVGGEALKRRLKAVRLSFKPIGRKWADTTVDEAKPRIPVKTGATRRSVIRKSATQRKAVVGARYVAYFIDAGSKAHTIMPKGSGSLIFKGRHGTVFSKKVNHPRIAARPFRAKAAHESLRKHPMSDTLIGAWNDAA